MLCLGGAARFHWVEGPVPQVAIEQDGRVVPFVLTELPFFLGSRKAT